MALNALQQALQDVQTKLGGTTKQVTSFVQSNPTPAGYISKALSNPVQQFIQGMQNSFVQAPKATQKFAPVADQFIRGAQQAIPLLTKKFTTTPVMPFIPQSTLPNIAGSTREIGRQLQKVNIPSIPIPESPLFPLSNLQGTNTLATSLKSIFPILQTPEQINALAQSYGRTLTSPLKHPLETAMNILPIAGITKAKPLSGTQELARERLHNLLNYPEILRERGFARGQIRYISAPEARTIIEEGISPIDHSSYEKMISAMANPIKAMARESIKMKDLPAIQNVQDLLDPNIDVKTKVNIFDYIRTPDRVLEKIGLKQQASYLRKQYESYISQLPEEIMKINAWKDRAPNPQSNENIFRYLDGESIDLSDTEKRLAEEIRGYLADWATKLKLPPTKQISNYITHIWQKGVIEGEFDPQIAKLIDQRVAGGVYDPFLLQRRGTRIDYLKDTWGALDAYVKRAVRKYNLDPALEQLKAASDSLELSQYKYVQKLTDRINMRPTEVDTLIDNFVKSVPGVGYRFGPRPVTYLTQKARQVIYRGALGMNVSSAIRNLTQGANTYAELGEKWTTVGYLKMLKNYAGDELERVGVLSDSFIQDQRQGIYKTLLERMDKGLFFLFEQAEKVNRGSAYYGAKARALSEGKTEEQAVEIAKAIVRKTQFTFGSIDTPLALSSDIAKTLSQFMSYNLKQAEFLSDKVVKKDVIGLMRYIVATMVMQKVLRDQFGMKTGNEDQNTIAGAIQNTLPSPSGYTPPAIQISEALYNLRNLTGTEAERTKALNDFYKAASLVVPGGVQIKKTLEGVGAYNKGYVGKDTSVKFPVEQSTNNYLRSFLFGQYSTPESQKYFDENTRPLSEKQSEAFREGTTTYEDVMKKRQENREDEIIKEKVNKTGTPQYTGTKIYYNDDGKVSVVDTAFIPSPPQYTGDTAEDKNILTAYKAELTRQKNKLIELVNLGLISEEKVNEAIKKLQVMRDQLGNATSGGSRLRIRSIKFPTGKVSISASSTKIASPKRLKVKAIKTIRTPSFKPLASSPMPRILKAKKYKIRKTSFASAMKRANAFQQATAIKKLT